MRKFLLCILFIVMVSVPSHISLANDGGNIEVESKIIFFEDEKDQDISQKEQIKKKPSNLLPKTGESKDIKLFYEGFLLLSFLIYFLLRKVGVTNEK